MRRCSAFASWLVVAVSVILHLLAFLGACPERMVQAAGLLGCLLFIATIITETFRREVSPSRGGVAQWRNIKSPVVVLCDLLIVYGMVFYSTCKMLNAAESWDCAKFSAGAIAAFALSAVWYEPGARRTQ